MSWRDRAEPVNQETDQSQALSGWRSRAIPTQEENTPKEPDMLSTLYHGAIEGGAMGVGGLAGATLGLPAGPIASGMAGVGLAAAMYPPAKRAAEAIDRYRGITPPTQPSVAQEYGEGLEIEAGGKVLGPVLNRTGKGLARFAETATGVKENIYKQATKQGISTYFKPSMETAQEAFGKALGPEGRSVMKGTADDAFDAALGSARTIGRETGKKIDQGLEVSAIDALKARQATDRVISATSITDQKTLNLLYDYRGKFDKVMSSQSEDLKNVSTMYRNAVVRDKLLNVTRLTKSGKPSAFLPMLLGAGGRGVAGTLSMMSATSPFLWGVGATTVGSLGKAIAESPTARRALISQFIENRSQGSR